MGWLETRNLQPVRTEEIPCFPVDVLRGRTIAALSGSWRVVQFFGHPSPKGTTLYVVLADDARSRLYIGSALFAAGDDSYPSFTSSIPALHLFEREFYEDCGIEPLGHPWLKPLRHGVSGSQKGREQAYPFFAVTGEEVHEVGVGPVHAGIIEPGHFRFSCHGEEIYHLEIQHGFQHRGVEKLLRENISRPAYLVSLAESIAGDSVVAHAGSHVRALEALGGAAVTRQAMAVRTIALELERVAMHLGDLAALANDVAYLTGQATFGAMRTKAINSLLAICGSRFGRGLLAPGGVNYGISERLKQELLETALRLEDDAELAGEVMFASASVLSRFEKTGVIGTEWAKQIGMVGPAARASGVAVDVRTDHPCDGFVFFPVHKVTLASGDVFARAYIRRVEIRQSLRIIRELLQDAGDTELRKPCPPPVADTIVVSLTEGWRGETVHTIITDPVGGIAHYKVTDPSFHNWFALALAVRNNGISDFPVCNKSFNLSYCGMDL